MHNTLATLLFLTSLSLASPSINSHTCLPSSIDWTDCAKVTDTPGLLCANFSVPADWSQPCSGPKIRLALAILPARVSSSRIGPLLFNTGGPGGAAVPELVGNGSGLVPFSDEMRDKFDLVAMDPRGVGQSEPILCNHTLYNEMTRLSGFPETDKDFEMLRNTSARFGQSCMYLTGPMAGFVDSRSVAQDFEAVRVALGDEPLNFLGLSYGTLIGQAYIELFPKSIRAMALDGIVEHTQRQAYAVLTEARTYEDVLDHFFDWCDTHTSCALHNNTLSTADLWDQLIKRADRNTVPAPGCVDPTSNCATEVSSFDIISTAQELLLLKHPLPGRPALDTITWPGLAEALSKAYYDHDATIFSPTISPSDSFTAPYVFPVVYHADWNRSITTFAELQDLMRLLETTAPHTRGVCEFYRVMLQTIGWPGSPAYEEKVPTIGLLESQVLLVNALHDPETSYDWAVALQDEIPGSMLLTRKGVGHTSYWLKGEAWSMVNEYLLRLDTPPAGTVVDS